MKYAIIIISNDTLFLTNGVDENSCDADTSDDDDIEDDDDNDDDNDGRTTL